MVLQVSEVRASVMVEAACSQAEEADLEQEASVVQSAAADCWQEATGTAKEELDKDKEAKEALASRLSTPAAATSADRSKL